MKLESALVLIQSVMCDFGSSFFCSCAAPTHSSLRAVRLSAMATAAKFVRSARIVLRQLEARGDRLDLAVAAPERFRLWVRGQGWAALLGRGAFRGTRQVTRPTGVALSVTSRSSICFYKFVRQGGARSSRRRRRAVTAARKNQNSQESSIVSSCDHSYYHNRPSKPACASGTRAAWWVPFCRSYHASLYQRG